MTKMRLTKQEIVDSINEMFPAENERYPVAFIVDGQPMVTSESFSSVAPYTVVDYWQEGNMDSYDDFGVSKILNEWLKEMSALVRTLKKGDILEDFLDEKLKRVVKHSSLISKVLLEDKDFHNEARV